VKGRSSSTPSKPVLDIKAFQRLLSAAYMLQQHSEGKADCAAIPKGIVKNLRPVLEVPLTLEPAVSQSVRPLAATRRLAHTEVEALKLKYDSLINSDLIPQETAYQLSVLASRLEEALSQHEIRAVSKRNQSQAKPVAPAAQVGERQPTRLPRSSGSICTPDPRTSSLITKPFDTGAGTGSTQLDRSWPAS
jgi:hypothetical protein